MTMQYLCPICEEGVLDTRIDLIEVEYQGHKTKLPSHYSVCNACGAEQASADQTRQNKATTLAFRASVEGTPP